MLHKYKKADFSTDPFYSSTAKEVSRQLYPPNFGKC